MTKYFGTDGIRGVAGQEMLAPLNVYFIGRAIGQALGENRQVIMGRDTRISGPEIAAQLAAGLADEGVGVVDLGIISTPGVSLLTRVHGAGAGIVISASHNPAADNGIKVFGPDGGKASESLEAAIEAAFDAFAQAPSPRVPTPWHHLDARAELVDEYVADLIRRGGGAGALAGMKVVLDCANGAASAIAPRVFEGLGAVVHARFCEPTGTNINDCCGALNPDVFAPLVTELGADIGFSFDGDADRMIAVDETGVVRDGDFCLAIWGRYLAEKHELPGDTVVTTVMANIGLELSLKAAGVKLERTKVGDKYVAARMAEGGFVLGGEQSGHILYFGPKNVSDAERAVTGDGILTAVNLAHIVRELGRPLSDLSAVMRKYPQILLNVPVTAKPVLEGIPAVAAAIETAENALAGQGRIVLRYSGTEPLARVMVEGPEQATITAEATRIAEAIRAEIGSL